MGKNSVFTDKNDFCGGKALQNLYQPLSTSNVYNSADRKGHDSVDICSVTGHGNIVSEHIRKLHLMRSASSLKLHKHGKAAFLKDPIPPASSES